MKAREKAEAVATERVPLMAPLLDEALDAARSRTLRRYVAQDVLAKFICLSVFKVFPKF